MQDAHYKRHDRHLAGSAIGEGGGHFATKSMVGDPLVFDFGEAQAVQGCFRQIDGIKVRLDLLVRKLSLLGRLCPHQGGWSPRGGPTLEAAYSWRRCQNTLTGAVKPAPARLQQHTCSAFNTFRFYLLPPSLQQCNF